MSLEIIKCRCCGHDGFDLLYLELIIISMIKTEYMKTIILCTIFYGFFFIEVNHSFKQTSTQIIQLKFNNNIMNLL